jgi:hypothetical protein
MERKRQKSRNLKKVGEYGTCINFPLKCMLRFDIYIFNFPSIVEFL